MFWLLRLCFRDRCLVGDDVGELGHFEGSGEAADAAVGELHDAVDEGEEGVILAHGHVLSGADFAAALANQDVAGAHDFSGVFFDA